jgi:SPX domain protein involved in polyphosphate accumulation
MTAAEVEIARELALPTMAPRLATWYRRLCLTGDGRRVRITLDENLTFCRPQPIGETGALAAPREREVVAAFPARVLEVKHCGEMPFWLGQALESLQPADSFSKFRMGMTALGHTADEGQADEGQDDEGQAEGKEAAREADGLAPAAPESPLYALGSFVAA